MTFFSFDIEDLSLCGGSRRMSTARLRDPAFDLIQVNQHPQRLVAD